MIITLDLESIPDQRSGALERIAASIRHPSSMSKPETIAAWESEKKPLAVQEAWLKTALDGASGQAAVIGMAINDAEPITIYAEDWRNPGAEREVLAAAFDAMTAAYDTTRDRPPLFVGHNLHGFDLPFLFKRAVILRVPIPAFLPVNASPYSDRIFDTMLAWAGARQFCALEDVCYALGIAGKGGMDGSKVWPMLQEGRIAEVAEYCAGDVTRARAIFKRMAFLEELA